MLGNRHTAWMNRLSQFSALCATLIILSSCSTVTDMVTSNLPESHSGRPSIMVSLRVQEAYLYRGGHKTASSRISSGREGYRTPVGRFQVIRKDEEHRSSVYGDYVDGTGHAGVTANRHIRSSWVPRCPTSSSSRPATGYTKATCRERPHHTGVLGCLIGKRASFITPSISVHWS